MANASRKEYQRRISLAIDYITKHLDDDISPEMVAEAAQFSKFHFYRIFKAMTGDSVAGFVRRLRLERAASKLCFDRDTAITEIALDAQFASTQSFNKAFQKQFGVSPSAYRAGERKIRHRHRTHGHPNRTNDDEWMSDAADNGRSLPDWRQQMKVTVENLPQRHVAYLRRLGPYGEEIAALFEQLAKWAGPRGLLEGKSLFGTYWDNPEITAPEKCRSDACVEVPPDTEMSGEVVAQTLPGGQYAVLHADLRADGEANEFHAAWESIYTDWLPDSGYQPDEKPAYEHYLQSPEEHPEGKWKVEICVPVKPL